MKLNMKEVTRAINENQFAPQGKWTYEEIESIDTVFCAYGQVDRYLVTVRVKAGKYDDNGIRYKVNHYADEDAYHCYYEGTCYLG
jgi:hypothetical protein